MITKIDPIDIWTIHKEDPLAYICIPTNLTIRNGNNVMGAGLALQANVKFAECKLPEVYGRILQVESKEWKQIKGVVIFDTLRIITFPTKWNYYDETADLTLIQNSAISLHKAVSQREATKEDWGMQHPRNRHHIYIPSVGCGLGRLKFDDVASILDDVLFTPRYVLIRPFTEFKQDARLISDDEYTARERDLLESETA